MAVLGWVCEDELSDEDEEKDNTTPRASVRVSISMCQVIVKQRQATAKPCDLA